MERDKGKNIYDTALNSKTKDKWTAWEKWGHLSQWDMC